MERCIGAAVPGAVRVDGGGENVKPPRLPIELPPPSRASATAGARAREAAATAARRRREPLRDIFVIALEL